MKSKIIFLTAIYILAFLNAYCQNTNPANPENYQTAQRHHSYTLPIDKTAIKGSYPLGVSEIKTIHVIFPSEIKEVDAGTAHVIAQITESFNNVLKIKANTDKPFSETNLTVLTADGGLYSFLTTYNRDPEILNINIGNNLSSDIFVSKELGINQLIKSNFQLTNFNVSATEIQTNLRQAIDAKANIKRVGAKNQTMRVKLQGIYTQNGLMYLSLGFENESNIAFSIDFIKLYIKDIQQLKRTTAQEEELKIIEKMPNSDVIEPQSRETFAIVTPLRTLSTDKELVIEIYEKNGGRHLRFPVSFRILEKSQSF